ncbi:colicin E1 family microcin immunity protein [Pseudomonas sp. QC2]|uniref:colicin E1 family microcin immunity protein n=3 Tax=Gammaproteobacteria TaxID=1236 RepID=UPI003531B986
MLCDTEHGSIQTKIEFKREHTLYIKYYFRNLIISVGIFILFFTNWFGGETFVERTNPIFLTLGVCSTFLFPFSRMIIEKTALRFTTPEFWTTGLFTESPGKNGLYAIFYVVCTILAVPICGIYLMYMALKKVA